MKPFLNLITAVALLGAVVLFTGCASKPPPSPVQRIVAGEGVTITEREGMLVIEAKPTVRATENSLAHLTGEMKTMTLEHNPSLAGWGKSHTAWDVVRLGITRGWCDCGTELVQIMRPSIPPQAGAFCPGCGKTK